MNALVFPTAAQLTLELEWDKLGVECNKSNLRSAQAEAELEVEAGKQESAGAHQKLGKLLLAAASSSWAAARGGKSTTEQLHLHCSTLPEWDKALRVSPGMHSYTCPRRKEENESSLKKTTYSKNKVNVGKKCIELNLLGYASKFWDSARPPPPSRQKIHSFYK